MTRSNEEPHTLSISVTSQKFRHTIQKQSKEVIKSEDFINKITLRYSRTLFCLETPTSSPLQTDPSQYLPSSHFYPLHYLSSFINYDHGAEAEISHPEAVKNVRFSGAKGWGKEEGGMLYVLLCCSTLPNFMWSG